MKDSSIFIPVDDYIRNQTSRRVTSYYPSSASCYVGDKCVGECLRKQYYRWRGVEPCSPSTYRAWLSARLGLAYEEAFVSSYKAQGLLRARNYPFTRVIMGLPISGRLDGLTKRGEVIECKSVYGKAFYMKTASVMHAPKPEHLCQIMVYLAALGLNTCLLPYGSRDDTGRRVAYRLTKEEIEKQGIFFIKIISRWKLLQVYLTARELPDRDFCQEDWQCRYCGYQQLCYPKLKR